jgi:choline dehydrogenase-like flavoprotein
MRPRSENQRLVVIGSGPAGVACAWALARRGFRPLVVDAGRRLEPERERRLRQATRPEGLDPALVAELERGFSVDIDRLPLKPAFGSLFPYAIGEPLLPLRAQGVAAVPSLALGGLSNVWGAAVLPYRDRDLRDWPVRVADLASCYRSTFEFVPLAGEHDELEELFPLYGDPERLEPTDQIAGVLARLRLAGAELGRSGAVAGRSRLAVVAGAGARGTPCRYTGLCMYGCPYGSIYVASATLDELRRAGQVDYRPGLVVDRLEEANGGVRLRASRLEGDGSETLSADRVFVACGVLGSTRLLLESLDAHERPVPLLESAYFTMPLLMRRRPARVGRGLAGNTLAQVFLEIDDPEVSTGGVHLQLYGYNDLMLTAVAARSRLPERTATRMLQPLLGRLLYGQGYLHSDDSPRLSAELRREGDRNLLVLSAGDGALAARRVAAVVGKLRALRPLTGFQPLASMLQIWPQGKGFHVGGSLPMRERPGELESDILGRPTGFRRVHVVDASVLPSIPATTIAFSVMANAQRIAAEHDDS